MREFVNEIKETLKSFFGNEHRAVLKIEDNAVLVVVNIRRILEAPCFTGKRNRNDSVIFARGMIYPARIADIFLAQKALWIARLFHELGSGDCLGVFFGLRKIDGDIHVTVRSF